MVFYAEYWLGLVDYLDIEEDLIAKASYKQIGNILPWKEAFLL